MEAGEMRGGGMWVEEGWRWQGGGREAGRLGERGRSWRANAGERESREDVGGEERWAKGRWAGEDMGHDSVINLASLRHQSRIIQTSLQDHSSINPGTFKQQSASFKNQFGTIRALIWLQSSRFEASKFSLQTFKIRALRIDPGSIWIGLG